MNELTPGLVLYRLADLPADLQQAAMFFFAEIRLLRDEGHITTAQHFVINQRYLERRIAKVPAVVGREKKRGAYKKKAAKKK